MMITILADGLKLSTFSNCGLYLNSSVFDFAEVCELQCLHGTCIDQQCECEDGWSGALCDQVECDRRCVINGYCNNGTCVCKPGWNGQHCSLPGCEDACNNNGACQLFNDAWRCSCRDGWKGEACQVKMEIMCEDAEDEDQGKTKELAFKVIQYQ